MSFLKPTEAEQLREDLAAFDSAEQKLRQKQEQSPTDGDASEAYRQGYVDGQIVGYADGLKQNSESLKRLQAAWCGALETWDQDYQRMLHEAQHSVVELAVALAQKIVQRMPRIDETIVVDQVTEALRHVTGPHQAVVRVNPLDRPLVEKFLPRLAASLATARHVACIDDPAVEPGGCIVTAGGAQIDATLDRQMQRLAHAVLGQSHPELEAA